jgi:hypothetical protein
MSRIFLSHSSANEIEAIALKRWQADNGWDDVFLDVDPERGLVAGERWQNARIRGAANRRRHSAPGATWRCRLCILKECRPQVRDPNDPKDLYRVQAAAFACTCEIVTSPRSAR